MNSNYVSMSLELNLFFARIMKEHALFLMAGFPGKNAAYIRQADWYRRQFEELLWDTVRIADRRVGADVLRSGELVTQYTMGAEQRTEFLTGIGINERITEAEKNLRSRCRNPEGTGIEQLVSRLNMRAIRLVEGLIDFKERIIREMAECRLFTFNYPLLVEHIRREAKLYHSFLVKLQNEGMIAEQDMRETEKFWNQIMMEHALFIRGLLDPSEEVLIDTADDFAEEYKRLLQEARRKDGMSTGELTRKAFRETVRYRDFKAAGTKGILECEIAGLIVPLLADHVLREANHYLRLLDVPCRGGRE